LTYRHGLGSALEAASRRPGPDCAREFIGQAARRADDRRRVVEEALDRGGQVGRALGDELVLAAVRVGQRNAREHLPLPDEDEAVVVGEHPVGQRLAVALELTLAAKLLTEVDARGLGLDEAHEPGAVLQEDVGLTGLLGVGLGGDQQVASGLLGKAAQEAEQRLAQRELRGGLRLAP
jgi:hypothetical protein